jgi:PST family polysaccharide transporter
MSGQTALVQGGSARQAEEQKQYLRTILWLFLAGGCLAALILVIMASVIAQQLLHRGDATAQWLVRLLALPVLLTVLTGYTLGVLNIHRMLGRIATIQIASAACSAALAYPVALFVLQGHETALIASLLITPLATFVLSILVLQRSQLLQPLLQNFRSSFRWGYARSFYAFAGVTVTTSLYQSGVMLVLRSSIVQQQGLSAAGIFDSAWTLSMTYVTLVTTAFSTYFMPTLSASASADQRRELVQRMFRFVTLVATPLILAVIVFKPFVIQLLFAEEFLPALLLMRWMLIGDYFKLSSWVLGYPMLATADLKLFFWSDLFVYTALLAGSSVSLHYFQSTEGVAITFLGMYVAYFVFTFAYSRRKLGVRLMANIGRTWLLGLVLVILLSLLTWNTAQVTWGSVAALALAVAGFYWRAFSEEEWNWIVRLAGAKLRLGKEGGA